MIPLPEGRGYVRINNSASFGLGEPYHIGSESDPKPAYMMSVFHQLHCLVWTHFSFTLLIANLNCTLCTWQEDYTDLGKSYVVQHYQTAFDGVNLTKEVAHHSAHCFDYLRQSIMCAADTSLEGKTEAGPGWGSDHQCKDYDAVLAWANERTVVKFRGNMPLEAVLWFRLSIKRQVHLYIASCNVRICLWHL